MYDGKVEWVYFVSLLTKGSSKLSTKSRHWLEKRAMQLEKAVQLQWKTVQEGEKESLSVLYCNQMRRTA